jgi:hypothetical protein
MCKKEVGSIVQNTQETSIVEVDIAVEKLTWSKLNLITQYKTKNRDLLAYNIKDIRTEQI